MPRLALQVSQVVWRGFERTLVETLGALLRLFDGTGDSILRRKVTRFCEGDVYGMGARVRTPNAYLAAAAALSRRNSYASLAKRGVPANRGSLELGPTLHKCCSHRN